MHPIIIVICLAAVPVIYALIRISRELDLLNAIDPSEQEETYSAADEAEFEAEVQALMNAKKNSTSSSIE